MQSRSELNYWGRKPMTEVTREPI